MQHSPVWIFSFLLCVLVAFGCGSRYVAPITLTEVATDKTYGYSKDNPVKIGGAAEGEKAAHREAFLNALRGPDGQLVSYVSHGKCCVFDVEAGGKSRGEIEVLLLSYPQIPKPVIVYLDVYHFESPKAPWGFSFVTAPRAQPQPHSQP